MLESQSPIDQSRRNAISLMLQNLPTSSTMSTECESVVPQSLGTKSLHHTSTLPGNSGVNEQHPLSGISYEGRLSLISPFVNYQQTLRTSLGRPSTQPSTPSLTTPYLPSSSFSNAQMAGLMNSDRVNNFFLGEEHRRNLYGGRPLANPSSSNDVFHGSHLDSQSNLNRQIKLEPCADSYDEPGTSKLPESEQNGRYYDAIEMLHSSRQENTLESTPDPKKFKSAKDDSPDEEGPKDLISTPTRMQFEGMDDDLYMNGENGSKQSSPYEVQGNEELEPINMDSDPEDSHEHSAAMNLMEQSFEESPAIFEHGENSMALKCTYCSYSSDSHASYNSHLNTHFDHKCTRCDFTAQTMCQLKVHSQEEHGTTVEEIDELESIRVPRINAQGKVKKFKCKQCGYVAVTKSDFWRHARSHIKSEKLLTCKKCPFVTEYKHHLEYHLRNHVGIKPFQCNKCTYSCVNKSMLNSHMKSHSNVYQYRCSNCTYATKYCHSLKLHLRKYGHTPAMVLNPDGSPNPVPIIDVYGTRRGPKLKKDDNGMPILPPHYQFQAQVIKAHMEVTGTIPLAPTAPIEKTSHCKSGGRQLGMSFPVSSVLSNSPFSLPANFQSYPSFIPQEFRPMKDQVAQLSERREQLQDSQNKTEECLNVSKSPEVKVEPLRCETCDFSTPSKDVLTHHNLLHKNNIDSERRKQCPSSPLNLGKVGPTSGMATHFDGNLNLASQAYNHMTGLAHSSLLHPTMMQPNLQDYIARAIMLQGLQNPSVFDIHPQLQRRPFLSNSDTDILRNESFHKSPSPTKSNETSPTQTEIALDLSKEQTPPNRIPSAPHPSLFATHSVATASTSSPSSSDVSTPPAKNRRKGRAFKLERIALRLSGSGEEGESSSHDGDDGPKDFESPPAKSSQMPPLVPIEDETNGSPTNDSKWKEAYNCQFCDIAFRDIVLYTMHMGYHGYKDAFTCNSCGFKAADKINFSLHIARAAHN